jgi:signal transduction histidine kinase/ActR/RegA family two-component response regulator
LSSYKGVANLVLDSQQIRAEPHAEIGDLLQSNVDVLVELWSDRAVQEQPKAKRVHHAVLQNHLREFLRTLGRSLAASEDPKTLQHSLPAAIHGEQRWETGWSLPEVVRDFQILRLVIVDFLEQTLERRLAHREVLAVGLALDEAIAASVVAFSQDRDQYFKQLEEEKAEQGRQAQLRLQEYADALLDADRRKNEFLAMLAHELRNPLAPVRNAVEILRLKGALDAETAWARDLIDRQVHDMTRMVDDLLDVSRITRGKVVLKKEPVAIATIVDRSVEEVRPLLEARKHQLTLSPCPEPLWVSADPTRLTQVLVNLLNNAIKFTDDGGRISLTTERDGTEIAIAIEDTGDGIPAHFLPHIFDPFMQEDRQQNRKRGGIGIGLALVRSLLDLHHGRVQAYSDGPGAGSRFVLHLPLMETPPEAAEEKARTIADQVPPRRILIVDDNEDAANSLKMLLEFFGHDVRLALSGRQALELAVAEPPQVVLLDIGLPQMNGLEVGRRLRADARSRHCLLIAVTGYGQDEDRRRSQEAGFNAHLVKPLDIAALHETLASFKMDDYPGAAPP